VLANPKVAATSLQEFVALAKANPNTLNYSTPGASSQAHLLFELWSQQAGIKMQHNALGQLAITHRLASITARRE
jgi:tripartite-type tricarboxylate transporter receptor subunit TctC